jgi:hypothetical protein
VAEIQRPDASMNDWNQGGRVDDFIDIFAIGALTGWTCPR